MDKWKPRSSTLIRSLTVNCPFVNALTFLVTILSQSAPGLSDPLRLWHRWHNETDCEEDQADGNPAEAQQQI